MAEQEAEKVWDLKGPVNWQLHGTEMTSNRVMDRDVGAGQRDHTGKAYRQE